MKAKGLMSERVTLILYEISITITVIGTFLLVLILSYESYNPLLRLGSSSIVTIALAFIVFAIIKDNIKIKIALISAIVGICIAGIITQIMIVTANNFSEFIDLVFFIFFVTLGTFAAIETKTRTKSKFEQLTAIGEIALIVGVIMTITLTF